jgi:ribokinase
MADIVVVGSLNMDITVRVPHIPKVGETILATEIHHNGGGKGANQAIAAARLGSSVAMIGKVGKDKNGYTLLKGLMKENIDITGLEFSEDITGTAFISLSNEGDNSIVVYPGANKHVDISQIERNRNLIENSKICVLQMEIPYEVIKYVANICYQKGIKVVFNPAPATSEIDDDLLEKCYVLVPNETELFILAGEDEPDLDRIDEAIDKVLKRGTKNIIVTLGDKGCIYHDGKRKISFESKKVKAVDTTAAGDSFIGALVTGLVEGKTLEESIEFAIYVAALTVTKLGAQNSLPTRQEVEDFIKNY